MADALLTGGCNCGAVRFEVTEPLVVAVYCHCQRCQRRTGTGAAASAVTAPGSFSIVSGRDKLRVWEPDPGGKKVFCARCGSHIYAENTNHGFFAVRLGAFDGDPGIRPTIRQFVAFAAPWEPVPDDGLTRFDERLTLPRA